MQPKTNMNSLFAKSYNIFESAGMWRDREINVQALRKEAWKRNH